MRTTLEDTVSAVSSVGPRGRQVPFGDDDRRPRLVGMGLVTDQTILTQTPPSAPRR
jgi:hypothetical protein